MWRVLTDLGDFLCASAVVGIALIWCALRIHRRVALRIGLAWSLVTFAVSGLKLVSQRLGAPLETADLLVLSEGAPSGHAAMAVLAYGTVALVMFGAGRPPWPVLGAVVCSAVIALVAVTRVTLQTHSAADVIAGLAIGAGSLIPLFATLRQRAWRASAAPLWELAALTTLAAGAMLASGLRLPSTLLI